MKSATYLTWLKGLCVLGTVVAIGVLASTAGAVGRPPDVQDVAAANLATAVTQPPDVRDVASRISSSVPDLFERYAAAHPFATGLFSTQAAQPPDIRDTALDLATRPSETLMSRPPDVADAALAIQYRAIGQPTGFGWGDWAVGIGTGMGLAIFVVAGLVVTRRQLRHRVQAA